MANRILREWDYDNDLNYENVYDSALDYITKYKPGVQSWREIASAIGYRMNTIGPNDMELLKDAIEDAMMESSRPVDPGDPSITANPMSNESRIVNNKLIRLTEGDLRRIVKESVNRILDEGWGSYVDYYYPDNEKETKENNYFNPEKEKREPSKSSRVRRREYMKNKQKMEQS